MAFQLYEQTRATGDDESVTINAGGAVSFSPAVTQKYLQNVEYVQVLFDSETKRVGVRPAKQTDKFTFKLVRPANSKRVMFSGRGFLRNYGLMKGDKFDADKFDVKYDKHERLITFSPTK